jgi:hypothetical protein
MLICVDHCLTDSLCKDFAAPLSSRNCGITGPKNQATQKGLTRGLEMDFHVEETTMDVKLECT